MINRCLDQLPRARISHSLVVYIAVWYRENLARPIAERSLVD